MSGSSDTGTRITRVEIKVENIEKTLNEVKDEQLRLWNKFDEIQKLLNDIHTRVLETPTTPITPPQDKRNATVGEFFGDTFLQAIRLAIIALTVGVIVMGAKAALEQFTEVEHEVAGN